ncbi:MAG TPA: T9SS type A sorting domain-containing protein, partial [Ignavibacteriales bacterium]|nr:T9SS type A sorting domain-containing protein [Ignavibacteriales bacterium]
KGFNIIVSNSREASGIYSGYGNSIIEFNKIINTHTSIYISDSNTFASENILINVEIGIQLFNSNSNVKNNQITNVKRGILIDAFTGNYYPIVEENIISCELRGVGVGFNSRPTIRNNIIFLNGDGAIGYQGGGSDSVWVYNNLVVASDGLDFLDGFTNTTVPTIEFNNFVIGEVETGIIVWNFNHIKNNVVLNGFKGIHKGGSGNDIIIKYNNAWNNNINYKSFIPDSTNISVDPMVVNEDSLDFHLQMFSPLIDAGDPDILDLDGTRSDIGLYGGPFGERYPYLDLAPKPPRNLTAVVDSQYINLSWNKNTEADFNSYNLFRDTTANFTADSTTFVVNLTDTFYVQIIPPGIDAFYYKLTAVDNQGNESKPSEELPVIITSINEYPTTVSDYRLYQNYPNPFNPSTKIAYKLKERGYVKLYVYDIKGELVEVLVNEVQEAGYHEVEFVGQLGKSTNLSSGVYIYQIMVKNGNNIPVFSDMKKMLLLK